MSSVSFVTFKDVASKGCELLVIVTAEVAERRCLYGFEGQWQIQDIGNGKAVDGVGDSGEGTRAPPVSREKGAFLHSKLCILVNSHGAF